MSRKRNLHCRNWWRYLYVSMRSQERALERQRRWFAWYWPRATLKTAKSSHTRLMVTMMKGADQCWRFLHEQRGAR